MAKTDRVQQKQGSSVSLDAIDRKILSALTQNAKQTNASLGQIAGLSAPAVHERVKRLHKNGVISRTVSLLDGTAIGKPLLSFIHVDADGWGKSKRMMRLAEFPEVEEIHSVAGDTCVILKVRTASPVALEHFLSQLYVLPGVRGTKSFIVLSTYVERVTQAEVTSHWPTIPLPPE